MKNPHSLLFLSFVWSLGLITSALPAWCSDNNDPNFIFQAATKFEQMGEINKAITFYKRVIEVAPNTELAKQSSKRLSHHLQGYTSPESNNDRLKNLPLRERIVVVPPTLDHPAVSSDAIHTAKHVIMRLPNHIYRMLDKAGTVIYLAPNATDKFPEALKNQKMVETKLPLSQENGRTYDQDIYIYEYATTTSTKLGPKRLVSDLINNLMHELGHAINNCQGNYASDREYMELLKMDVDSITPETKESLRIYTRNTEASAEEEQAEVVAYLLGSRTRSALTIGSQFANTRNYVRRKLSL